MSDTLIVILALEVGALLGVVLGCVLVGVYYRRDTHGR